MRLSRKGHWGAKASIFAIAAFGALLMFGTGAAVPQMHSPSHDALTAHHTKSAFSGSHFEVVSIRPAKNVKNWMIGTYSDEYRAIGLPLAMTLERAYFPYGYMFDSRSKTYIQGAPKWLWTEPYSFVGKVAPANLAIWRKEKEISNAESPNKMLQAMLRAALKERCKLVVHTVPAEIQGYALILAKGGPNKQHLRLSRPDEQVPNDTVELAMGGRMQPIAPKESVPALKYFHTSMASLAATLPTLLGAPVENKTGLNGKYDFSLIRINVPEPSPSQWDWHRLGLRLKPIKMKTSTVVIEHIEKPSQN